MSLGNAGYKKRKLMFIIVLIAFVAVNAFWLIQLERLQQKVDYHATHLCELQRLSVFKELIPKGTQRATVEQLCLADEFECSQATNGLLIDYANVVDCPASGRPYCGFRAELDESNRVLKLVSGYPCH